MKKNERLLGQNDVVRYVSRDAYLNRKNEEIAFHTQVPDPRGAVLLDLLKSWGMVVGRRGRDTTSGHPAMELASVEEVVTRAVTMTEQAFAAMKTKGWLVELDRSEPSEEPTEEHT